MTEESVPMAKNIYGVSKLAAENLCELFQRNQGLPCIVLRTSRFFPEDDDDETARSRYDADNLKVNELLYRRVDMEDVVTAHLAAMDSAPTLRFGRFIISATSPFTRDDLALLRTDARAVVGRHFPGYTAAYARRGWSMLPSIDRVYVNEGARAGLGWAPRYNFGFVIEQLSQGGDFQSPLARAVGAKGYHAGSAAL
jgi:UDP-glucose 4-epimerase